MAIDLTGRSASRNRPRSSAEITIQSFMEQGLSRRAAGALTALGCVDADDVRRLRPNDFYARRNCGRVTRAELRAFAQQRHRQGDR